MRTKTPSTRSATSSPADGGRGSSNGWEGSELVLHNTAPAKQAKSVVISTSIPSEERGAVPPRMKRLSPHREEERRTAAAACTQRHMPLNYRRTNHRHNDDAIYVSAPPSSSAMPKTQFGSSKEADIWKPLSRELVDIKAVLGGESGDATIHQMVSGLEHRMRGEHKVLKSIQGELNELGERVAEVASASASASATVAAMINTHGGAKTEVLVLESNKEMMQVLEEVKARLSTELPLLVTKLEEIKNVQEKEEKETELPIVALHNITKSLSPSGGDESKAIDLKPILDKLEEIRILCNVPPKQEVTSKEVDGSKEEDPRLPLEVNQLPDCFQYRLTVLFFVTITAPTENPEPRPGGRQQAIAAFSTTGR